MRERRSLTCFAVVAASFALVTGCAPQHSVAQPARLAMPERASPPQASGVFVSCAQVPPHYRCRWVVRYAWHGTARFPFAAVPLIVGSPQNVSNDARFIVTRLDAKQATIGARDRGGQPLPKSAGLVMLPVVYR